MTTETAERQQETQQQTCFHCGEDYPYPVEYHHAWDECMKASVVRFLRKVDLDRDDYDGDCRCEDRMGWCGSCAEAMWELRQAFGQTPAGIPEGPSDG